eukprot:6206469-Pyramimonas_sp.AAC.1
MAWRRNAPWWRGRRDGRGGRYSNGHYSVCSKCSHWEYDHFGNTECSKCGGACVDDGPGTHPPAPAAAQVDFAADLN